MANTIFEINPINKDYISPTPGRIPLVAGAHNYELIPGGYRIFEIP